MMTDFNLDYPFESSPSTENDDGGGYDLLTRHPLYIQALNGFDMGRTPEQCFSRLQRQFPDFPESLIRKAMSLAALMIEECARSRDHG